MAEIPKTEAPLDVKEAVAGVVDLQNKRVSGKSWKLQKTPTVRAQKTKHLRRTWAQRSEERAKQEAVKAREREMKDEIQAEKDRKREITTERRRAKEEKERYEALQAKMSAKRLQRLRKREARKKARV